MAHGTIRHLPNGKFQVDFQSIRVGQRRFRRNFTEKKAADIFLKKTQEKEALEFTLQYDDAWRAYRADVDAWRAHRADENTLKERITAAAEEARIVAGNCRDWQLIIDWPSIDQRGRLAIIWTIYGGRCRYCGRETKIGERTGHGATLDHITPVIAGGPDTIENITLACRRCNSIKGHRSE